LASIVLAGILGGLSYDGFKLIISKIKNSFNKLFSRDIPDDKWLEEFYAYLVEYYLALRNRDRSNIIFKAYVDGVIGGSMLRAGFEHSPEHTISYLKLIDEITKKAKTGATNIILPIQIPAEKTPKHLIEKHMKELISERAKMERQVQALEQQIKLLKEKRK